jgi:23S rRNA G2069 N7-methylase RlmK/C1962 C5-methylase RlmI
MTTTWYGIRTVGEDISISEAKVAKETKKTIRFDDTTGNVFRRGSVCKNSMYEMWFPTREEAVAEKLKMLKRDLRRATEGKEYAKTRLREFKERENV